MNISFPTDEQEDDEEDEKYHDYDGKREETTPVNDDFYLYDLYETIMKVHK